MWTPVNIRIERSPVLPPIKPGTRSEDIPDDWSRPDCGNSEANFQPVECIGVIATFAPI
jgi:hypothetical protein